MSIHTRPVELLQTLLGFDTTNPPGNELACIRYIDGLLQAAGIETQTFAKDPNRPNLIARLPGAGTAPPLLLQGHVDVVPTTGQQWTHPPFAGRVIDGMVWGRGTLDMKGAVTMMICAMLDLKQSQIEPAGDIILCVLSDEEAGGFFGARFMVEEHPEQFEGVQHAIGEFGGFPMRIGGKTFYPIQIAEKLQCQLKLTTRGKGGHGSRPFSGTAMSKMADVLTKLDRSRLPIHVTPATRMMVEGLIAHTSPPTSTVLSGLLNEKLSASLFRSLSSQVGLLEPMFRNTVSPTILRGGDKINVIPSEVVLEADGRMLPGFTPETLSAELQDLLGDQVEIEVMDYDTPASAEPDMGQFELLASILRDMIPDATPLPYMQPAVTDGRFFGRLGIQTYGFTPLNFDPSVDYLATIHSADERVPAAAIEFGTRAMSTLLQRYGRGA